MATVNRFPQSMREVIDLAMRKHRVDSGRRLAAESEKLGIPINYTVINQLWSGQYRRRMSPLTRQRLAKLSGVNQRVIDRLAGAPISAPFRLPEDQAATLTGDQREAVLAVVRAFAAANVGDEVDQVEDEAAYDPKFPKRDDDADE